MAYHQSTLLLIALVCLSTASISHGLILNNQEIAALKITGVLYCSISGNNLGGSPGVAGVTVTVTVTSDATKIYTAVTDSNGSFTVLVKATDGTLYDPSLYVVTVALPVQATCDVLPKTGILSATVSLLDVVVDGLLGNVAECVISPFLYKLI